MWRRFWRCGRDDWERFVYGHGVRDSGALIAILLTGFFTWEFGRYSSHPSTIFGYAGIGFMVGVFVVAPITLMLGHIGCQALVVPFGIKKTDSSDVGNLPLVADEFCDD